MKTTFLDVKNSRIPAHLGLCPTDTRLAQYVNEAQQRILPEGKWWGTTPRFNICATNGCITLPPQIATIERVNICGMPVPIRDFWWEFLDNGPGSASGSCTTGNTTPSQFCGMADAIMRGTYPSFQDITGTGKKLKFVCDLLSDVGKTVRALGYDTNGNWIRTLQSGVYADGEIIAFAQSAGTVSTNTFSIVTDLQFVEDRDGQVWMYDYEPVGDTQVLIGKYEYFEKRPAYARYYFPQILARLDSTTGACTSTKVEIVGKLEFIPVKNDEDYLIIANIPALKEMCKAIVDGENEPDSLKRVAILATGLAAAKAILDAELSHYYGDGRRIGVNITGSSVGYDCPVEVLV